MLNRTENSRSSICVLFVDDEKEFLESLKDGFGLYGPDMKLLTAGNGREAIRLLESERVDLVVTDLKMPELDGFQLSEYIAGYHPGVPVVVMTSYGDMETSGRLKSLNIPAYIEKPVDLDEIFACIKEVLLQYRKGFGWIAEEKITP